MSRTFVEIGPDGVLSAMGADAAVSDAVVRTRATRRPGPADLAAHRPGPVLVRGVAVNWAQCSPPADAASSCPPTPSSTSRYWLAGPARRRAPADRTGHPLFDTAVTLAEAGGERVLTGHWSAATCRGSPTTGRRRRSWCPAPRWWKPPSPPAPATASTNWSSPPRSSWTSGGAQIQVRVGAATDEGRRPVTIHASTDGDAPGPRHATGTLAPTDDAPVLPVGRSAAAAPLERGRTLRRAVPTRPRLRPGVPGGPDRLARHRRHAARRGRPAGRAWTPAATASTRRCSTRPCTPSASASTPATVPPRCRSRGPGSPSTGRRAAAAQVRLSVGDAVHGHAGRRRRRARSSRVAALATARR